MSDLELAIDAFVEPTFGENAYLLSSADGEGRRVGWVIDPSFEPQAGRLLDQAKEAGVEIQKVILTHGHADHIAGVDAICDACPGAQVLIAKEDAVMLADAGANLSAPFGLELTVRHAADGDLTPGAQLILGRVPFSVLDTSGHSPGGRSLYCPDAGVVLTGDALFSGSIGRTDFPGSHHGCLLRNIRQHLLALPPETIVYSGHGPSTTIGDERKSNPFLAD